MKIKVKITKRWRQVEGVQDGTTVCHVMLASVVASPFSGCPLGRGRTEIEALLDLVRPGYALPYDTKITLDDLEVVEREDLATSEYRF
jgi:hypothetical protein